MGRNLTQGFLMHCCVINGDKHSTVSVGDFGEAMAIFSKFARIMDLKLDDQDDAIPGGTYWDMPQLRVCQLRHYFGPSSRAFLRSTPHHARRAPCFTWLAETGRALAI